jgi:hypothetical protein
VKKTRPDPVLALRGRRNVLVRHYGADDPRTVEAAHELESARAEDRITRAVLEIVEQAPLMSPEQRDRLAVLLRGGT